MPARTSDNKGAKRMAVTLYGWWGMFDLPSPSPFVMKADIQLQMMGIGFDRAIADLESVPRHKAPYVRDDGLLVEDSTFIRWHFERKLGVDLDQGLTDAQRGMAWSLQSALENRLSTIQMCERWLDDGNFDRGPRHFFAGVPEGMRDTVIAGVRADLAATLNGNGIGRLSRDERLQLAAADIDAVAAMLGDQPYVFGTQATSADATACGVLASCATRFFDTPLPDLIARHDALTAYLGRMQDRFFADGATATAA